MFEVKFAATTEKAEALLTKAVSQIKSRRYGERPHGKKLIRVALVYSAEIAASLSGKMPTQKMRNGVSRYAQSLEMAVRRLFVFV